MAISYLPATIRRSRALDEMRGIARSQRAVGLALVVGGASAMIAASVLMPQPGADDGVIFGGMGIIAGWGLLFHSLRRRMRFLRTRIAG